MNRGLSLYLDVMRVGAALAVLIVHLAYNDLSGGQLAPWRTAGNDAVTVFFVLSGFVIAHVAATRETNPRDYALSRLARLWSVAIPALAITVVLDRLGAALAPIDYSIWWYQGAGPVVRPLAALTFTNELWFLSVRPFSNGPWWSLGYEAWFYAVFGAWAFLKGAKRLWIAAALCLVAGPKILLLFPVWLLGAAIYRRGTVGTRAGAALFLGSIGLYALFRWLDGPGVLLDITREMLGAEAMRLLGPSESFAASYVIGLLAAANIVGARALAPHLERLLAPAAGLIRWTAGSAFALYLLHYPLLRFIAATTSYDRGSPTAVAGVFAVTLALCLLAGAALEPRKRELRALLDRACGVDPERGA